MPTAIAWLPKLNKISQDIAEEERKQAEIKTEVPEWAYDPEKAPRQRYWSAYEPRAGDWWAKQWQELKRGYIPEWLPKGEQFPLEVQEKIAKDILMMVGPLPPGLKIWQLATKFPLAAKIITRAAVAPLAGMEAVTKLPFKGIEALSRFAPKAKFVPEPKPKGKIPAVPKPPVTPEVTIKEIDLKGVYRFEATHKDFPYARGKVVLVLEPNYSIIQGLNVEQPIQRMGAGSTLITEALNRAKLIGKPVIAEKVTPVGNALLKSMESKGLIKLTPLSDRIDIGIGKMVDVGGGKSISASYRIELAIPKAPVAEVPKGVLPEKPLYKEPALSPEATEKLPVTPKAVYGEPPSGPYAKLSREVDEVLKMTEKVAEKPGVIAVRTKAIDKVIVAYENKTITRRELENLLEEISPERFELMGYGELNDFLLYWRGRFKPGAVAIRAGKPMTEAELQEFLAARPIPEVKITKPPVTPEVTKQSWQMTQKEAVAEFRIDRLKAGLPVSKVSIDSVKAQHKAITQDALLRGKPVSAEVLKDYPDLAKAIPKAEAGIAKPPIAEVPKGIPPEKPPIEPPVVKVPQTGLQANKELQSIRAQAKPAGALKPPKTPRKVTEEALREAGVQLPTPRVSKSPWVTLGIKPMREIARADPVAGEIARMGRNAYGDYEMAVFEASARLDKAFKGLTLPELEKLVSYQEQGLLTEKFLKGLSPQYRTAIKDGIQWFNKEIRAIAEKDFGIDTSKWSFTDENYFHHLFLGDHVLKVKGEIQFIGRLNAVYTEAQNLITKGIPPADIAIGLKFAEQPVSATLLKRKGFWRFVNAISKQMEISADEVLSEMRGVAAIAPRGKFVGAFLRREANLEGYLKDPRLVYRILWDRIQRKRFLEPFAKKATDMTSKIKTPWLAKEMEGYIKEVAGVYKEPETLLGITVSRLVSTITRVQSQLKLGYRPSTAFVNRLQPLQMTLQELGPRYYALGEGMRFTPTGREIVSKLKILGQRPKFATGERFAERGAGREALWKPLGIFSKAELQNREVTGIGAYLKGIREFKMTEQEAIQFADDMVSATQLIYDVSDLPKVFRHPIGRMALQFKPFVINYIWNAWNIILGKPLGGLEKYAAIMQPTKASKVARAATFFGTNFAVGGLRTILGLISPTNLGIITYLAIKYPEVFKGALGYVGIDVSKRMGASPFDLIPGDKWDLLGLVAGDAQRFYKVANKYIDSEDPKDLIEVVRISPQAWAVYRAFAQEEGVQPTFYERILTALGFEPTRLSDIRDGLRYIHYTAGEQATRVGYLPTERALRNMIAYTRRTDADPKRAEICAEILELSGIPPAQYNAFLAGTWKLSGVVSPERKVPPESEVPSERYKLPPGLAELFAK